MLADDLRQIEDLHRQDRASSLAKDLDALVSLMDEDAVLIMPGGPPTRGRAVLAAGLRASFAETRQDRVLEYVHDFEEIKIIG